MERLNGLIWNGASMDAFVGGRLQILQILQSLQGFQRAWIKASGKQNGMWVDLKRGMRELSMLRGAEVDEMN
jgi:hypothetical protein